MKTVLLLLLVFFLTQCYLNEIDVNSEVTDYYFMEESDVHQWFGKKHLQKNKKLTTVLQTEPLIWGQHDRVITMLQVNHQGSTCQATRSVIFVIDTASPYTYISELTLKRISKDCFVKKFTPSKVPISINGRPHEAKVSKDFNEEVNIIGMDFMKANNVHFQMKINGQNRDKSQLKFIFDTQWKKQL